MRDAMGLLAMATVALTVHVPDDLWRAVQVLAPHEDDTNSVILRALEEDTTATQKRRGRQRPGKSQQLVRALSRPVAELHLSARPASALRSLNIRYVYELRMLEPAISACERTSARSRSGRFKRSWRPGAHAGDDAGGGII